MENPPDSAQSPSYPAWGGEAQEANSLWGVPHSLMGLSIPRPNFPQPLRLRQDLPNASVCTPAAEDPQAFQRIRLHQQRSTLPLCRLLVQKSLGFPSCADLLFLHCASQDDLLSSARDMAFPTSFVCFGLCDNPLNHGQLMNYHYKHRLQIHIQSSLWQNIVYSHRYHVLSQKKHAKTITKYQHPIDVQVWLVVWTPLKNMSSSNGIIVPNWMETHKIPWFQTTNQVSIVQLPSGKLT